MQSSSIGIIGGADGPTAILLSGSPILLIFIAVIIAAVIVAAVIFLTKRK